MTINQSINDKKFPEKLKLQIVHPYFKKRDHFDKKNYKPVTNKNEFEFFFKYEIHNQKTGH